MAEVLLITVDDIKRLSSVGGNVDTDKIVPFVKVAQDLQLQPILGTKLLDKLKTLAEGGSFTGEYATLMAYVKPCLVHYAIAEFLPFLAYSITNGGITKYQSDTAQTIERDELNNLIAKEEQLARHYGRRLVEHLRYYRALYPEYTHDQLDGMHPDEHQTTNVWVL